MIIIMGHLQMPGRVLAFLYNGTRIKEVSAWLGFLMSKFIYTAPPAIQAQD